MKRVALIGCPVGHSVSPMMHNAAFQALGLNWQYCSLETPRRDLSKIVQRLRRQSWAGANVTVPHKEAALDFIDEADPDVRALGALNTIENRGGRLIGHNTDVQGFLSDLMNRGISLQGKTALVLGSGGAARAVCYALAKLESRILLICRSKGRGMALLHDLESSSRFSLEVMPWEIKSFQAGSEACDLIINTTPLGMFPRHRRSPWPEEVRLPKGAFVYDLIYNPPETRFLREAREAGLATAGGLGMLVHQGALAFEIWTGQQAPLAVMYEAARDALESIDA